MALDELLDTARQLNTDLRVAKGFADANSRVFGELFVLSSMDRLVRETLEPLNDLLKNEAKGKTAASWAENPEKYDESIRRLKTALCNYPVLRQPNFELPYVVYTDASDYALGAVLCQLVVRNPLRDTHFTKGRVELLSARKRGSRHHFWSKEIPENATRKPFQNQMPYVPQEFGMPNLECLTNAKEMAGRMARWAMIMFEHNYQVEYIKGVTNTGTAGDALSRLIALKDSLWSPLTMSAEDTDDDSNHPFLMLWPDVHLLLTAHQHCAAASTVIPFEGNGPIDDRDLFTLNTDILKWMETEDTLNDANSEMDFHERVLFSRTSVYVGNVTTVNIHKGLYAHCPDFEFYTATLWISARIILQKL